MKIFCDDGSTNVKLAWFEGKTLKSAVSVNSFRHNWKVEGLGSSRTYNYLLDGRKYLRPGQRRCDQHDSY